MNDFYFIWRSIVTNSFFSPGGQYQMYFPRNIEIILLVSSVTRIKDDYIACRLVELISLDLKYQVFGWSIFPKYLILQQNFCLWFCVQ